MVAGKVVAHTDGGLLNLAVPRGGIPSRLEATAVAQQRTELFSIAPIKPFFGHAARDERQSYCPVSPKQSDTSVQD